MKHDKKRLLKAALTARGSHNSKLFFLLRWIYTVKLMICILLGREDDFAPREDLIKGLLLMDKQRILWHPDPNVHFWTEYSVGRGLFKNWYYDAYPESTAEGNLPEGENNGPAENRNLPGVR